MDNKLYKCLECNLACNTLEKELPLKILGQAMPALTKANVCTNCGMVVSFPRKSNAFIIFALKRSGLGDKITGDPSQFVEEANNYLKNEK